MFLQTYRVTNQNYQLPGVFGTKSGPSRPSEDLQDPQKGHFGSKRVLLGPLWGQEESQHQAKVCGNHDCNPVRPIGDNRDQIWS